MKKTLLSLFILTSGILLSFTFPHKGYHVGDKAADFSLKNIDGSMVSMEDYKDANGFILVFTCNTCPWAVMYEDRLVELHKTYADQGYPLIAINPNNPEIKPGDSFEAMQVRAKEKGFQFPYVFDEKQTVYPEYGATKTPHVYLLDKDRIVQYIGAIDDSPRDASKVENAYVAKAIEALKTGRKPDPSSTKAIGCSIKA